MTIHITLANEQDTDRLGAILAKRLPDGAVVAMLGTLGAGKTRLVQGVAKTSGVDPEEVGSPTFVLVKEYQGNERMIYHFDAYRLRDSDEFLALGVDEYFDSDGVSFVEWADRVDDILTSDRFEISISPVGETSRDVKFTALGEYQNDKANYEFEILEEWRGAARYDLL